MTDGPAPEPELAVTATEALNPAEAAIEAGRPSAFVGGNAALARRLGSRAARDEGMSGVDRAMLARLVASGQASNAAASRILARDAPAAAPAGAAADTSQAPGPALKIAFGDQVLPFDVKFGAAVASPDASAKISKEIKQAKQFPLSPGIVGNFGISGEAGVEAKANITGSVSRTALYVPTVSGAQAYADEFTLGGKASLEAFVKGGVKVGVGVGWPGANVSGNLTGSLGAGGSTSVSLAGKATRTAIPDQDDYGDWSGSIAMPVDMGLKLEAAVGGSIDFTILFASGSLAQWEFGKWTIAEGKITCSASVGIPGGLVTDSVEVKDLEVKPPPTTAPAAVEGSPPWGEGSGAEGAGPGVAPPELPPEEPPQEPQN